MKTIEIKTFVISEEPTRILGPIELDQTVKVSIDEFGIGLQLKSSTKFDTGTNIISIKKVDAINALKFLLEKK